MNSDTMIVTEDSRTATRIAVIGERTGSSIIAGAKAMMVENLKRQMRNGVAHFAFVKKNGEFREAWGTTNGSLLLNTPTGTANARSNLPQQRISTLRQVHGGRSGGKL